VKRPVLTGAAAVAAAVVVALGIALPLAGGDDPRTGPPADPAPLRPAVPGLPRLPGEFERQDGLIISAAQMIQFHPDLLTDIVTAAGSHVGVMCLVGGDRERDLVAARLTERGLPPGIVRYLEAPMSTMWVRDWGPVGVEGPEGDPLLVDAHYEGNRRNRSDDLAAASIAAVLGLPVRELPLTMEGGDLLSNGRGLGLTSRRIVQRNAASRGYDTVDVAGLLESHFGIVDWFPLPSLVGEPTGHVDMFAAFVDPVTVVVGRYDPAGDPTNAALLDRVAAALAGFDTRAGAIRVERVTMPARPDGIWRTYTNVVFANGRVLVPQYPGHSPDLDAEALALYERLLPGREIVGIDCTGLIRRNGALHCVTLNLPTEDREAPDGRGST